MTLAPAPAPAPEPAPSPSVVAGVGEAVERGGARGGKGDKTRARRFAPELDNLLLRSLLYQEKYEYVPSVVNSAHQEGGGGASSSSLSAIPKPHPPVSPRAGRAPETPGPGHGPRGSTGVLGGAGAISNGRASAPHCSGLAASMVAVGLVPPSVAQQLLPPVPASAVAEGAGTVASSTPATHGSRSYDFDEGSDVSGATDGIDGMPNGNGGTWKGKGKSSDRRGMDGARGAGSGGYGNAGSGGEGAGGDAMDMENPQEEGAQGGGASCRGQNPACPQRQAGKLGWQCIHRSCC